MENVGSATRLLKGELWPGELEFPALTGGLRRWIPPEGLSLSPL